MIVENPVALRFLIEDDLFLLNIDKNVTSVAPLATPQIPVNEFKYLGGNHKNFLIMVHYAGEEFMDGTHLAALENILKRKELATDDVAILNMAQHLEYDHEQIITFFSPKRILIMGEKALPKGIGELSFNVPQAISTCTALYSFDFEVMMNSTENKRAFWDQVKAL